MTAGPLVGRRALVTGGSRGIGAEIVRRLAADGAAVAFTYGASSAEADKLAAEVTADGGTAVAIQADSAEPEQVASAVDETVSRLGGLEIVVNNAGVAYIAGIESFPMEQFDRLVAINVRGVFAAIQRAVPHLGDNGRIITIGSINADRVPVPGLSVYAMTKAAVAGLTRALARDLGPMGIRVNAIVPGWIMTERQVRLWLTPEGEQELLRRQCLKRKLVPEDVARVVLFFAADDSAACTNQSYVVDGGWV